MSSGESTSRDDELITRIKAGDQQAWKDLIEKYEGRLIAYVDCRIHNRSTSEDIVQEAFIGFLNSLANYDPGRSLESYLFSICAYKLTDHLRREGRRPKLQLRGIHEDDSHEQQWIGHHRVASSIARSAELKKREEVTLQIAIVDQIEHWKTTDQWLKLKAIELLFVKGTSNQQTAAILDISEQQVANFKSDFQIRLRKTIQQMNLDESSVPELDD